MTAFLTRHSKVLSGIGYLVLLAALVATSILAFQKRLPWQTAAEVTLDTRTPGLELNVHSDVKFQGLRVGEVRAITSDGTTARIRLALDDNALKYLPANVDAAIVPKTLFGEKFVDLRLPASPSTARLAPGDRITQSSTSVEISALFSRLVPVLRALHPDQLSLVLNGLAQALQGRGEVLARTLNQIQGFATALDPHLAALTHDIDQFARTADIYASGAPDLLRLMDAAAGISKELLVPQEQDFADLLDQAGVTSDDLRTLLARNSGNVARLSGRSRAVLALLDHYRTVLPCTLTGLHTLDTLGTRAIGGHGPFTNLTVDVFAANAPYVAPKDLPSRSTSEQNNANLPWVIPNWKPHCPVFSPENLALKPATPNEFPLQGTALNPPSAAGTSGRRSATIAPAPSSAAIQDARLALARALAAREMGVAPQEVPGFADLLLAPMLTDGEVRVR